jgi:hypothetical protein
MDAKLKKCKSLYDEMVMDVAEHHLASRLLNVEIIPYHRAYQQQLNSVTSDRYNADSQIPAERDEKDKIIDDVSKALEEKAQSLQAWQGAQMSKY